MKRKLASLLVAVTLFGCGMPQQVEAAHKKSYYLNRVSKIQKKEDKIMKESENGPQVTMNMAAGDIYKLWDRELNFVYNDIRKGMSKKKKEALKESEVKWIKLRDQRAEVDAKDWEGGSGYAMIYNGSLGRQTKKRIKWLINNYAK